VQYGTGNLVPCSVGFVVKTDGKNITGIERVGMSTAEWLTWEPAQEWMANCEGPMPYEQAHERHIRYPRDTPEVKAWQEENRRKWLARAGLSDDTLTGSAK
jgi:hypothetical protein